MSDPRTRRRIWQGLTALTLVVMAVYAGGRWAAQPRPLPVYAQVGPFQLTNQLGRQVTAEELRGRIWVAGIIFTRCPGPCRQLSTAMGRLQAALPTDGSVQLVSLTADPEFDTPEVLRRYAEQYRADPARWLFLTGPRQEINRLATGDLLLALAETAAESRAHPQDLFVHSTKFVVVDGAGQVRGLFEGTDPASDAQVRRTIAALRRAHGSMTTQGLPGINACLNGLSAALLLAGYVCIKRQRREAHRNCMVAALLTSTLFLAGYLTYHASVSGLTRFREPAWFRPLYLALLASHTVLAGLVVPLVLATVYGAWRRRFEQHRAVARWTWPVWLYVSVTGVLIYLLLYRIFPQG
jgi:protein SCO1/2/putative membrane protein